MPLYSDYGMYYGGGGGYSIPPPAYSALPYSTASSSYSPYGRIGGPVAAASPYSSPVSTRSAYPVHSSSRYSPMLSTITETSPYSAASISAAGRYAGMSSLMRINSPKVNLHSSPKYVAPRPIRVNTADIDVSSARFKRTLPIITPTRINNSHPVSISSSRPRQEEESRRSHSETPPPQPPEEPHFMPRCDENDAPPQPQHNHPIKRDRTIVRISTVRQRSKGPSEMPALASERGPPNIETPTPVIVVDVSNITMGEGNAKRTWRDNFGEDLLMKPKEAVRKTPGELLLERHLIKAQKEGEEQQGSIVDIVLRRKTDGGDSIDANKIRRPSFHDICQEISSDKIESVDDLNAGELRRRASLLPDADDDEEDEAVKDLEAVADEEVMHKSNGHSQVKSNNSLGDTHRDPCHPPAASSIQVSPRTVNKITKSASGTLHCLLERHLHNNNNSNSTSGDSGNDSAGSRRSVKRVHHKITAKVHIDEPINRNGNLRVTHEEEEESGPDPLTDRVPQLNAIVEHVSEHHHVNHVVKLPGKRQQPKEALPKKIIRSSKPTSIKDAGEDFWGALGTRETIYCQNRKQNMTKRLQTCTEDAEEVQQFQESVLSEVPESPTVEQMRDEMSFDSDVLRQVLKKKKVIAPAKTDVTPVKKKITSKKLAAAAVVEEAEEKNKKTPGDDQLSRIKTTIAEKSERCENNNNGLKIASAAIKTTTKPTRDLDAKSPATQPRRVIDSSHEEVVAVVGAEENRNKQTPVSSITTPTTDTSKPPDDQQTTTKGDLAADSKAPKPLSATMQEETAVVVLAAPKKKKIVIKKSTATEAKKPAPRTKIIEEEDATSASASGGSSHTSSSNATAAASAKSPQPVTRAPRAAIKKDAALQREKSPSGKSSSCMSSTTSTLSSVAAALETTTTTTTNAAAAHRRTIAAEDQSIPGSLSKFPTIGKLNLLSSVDSDQSSAIDEMAIEISRAQKTDPASAAAAPASATAAASSVSSSSVASESVSATNSGDGMDKASPSSSTGPKKKRVVRKVVKRIRQSPAERSNSDVNIGIWSLMPHHKKGAHHRHRGEGEDDDTAADDQVISEEQNGGEEVVNSNINNNANEQQEGGTGVVGEGATENGEPEAPKETIQELIRRLKGKDARKKKKTMPVFDPQKCQKFSPDSKVKLFTVDEKAPKTLWATPRPLQKKKKVEEEFSSDEDSSEEQSDGDETPVSSSTESEEAPPPPEPRPRTPPEEMTLNLYGPKDERMSSTCSNDSGFEGGTAPSSPRNMLECDVNCHKKCEKLTANLCGVNQKLIVEALSSVRRGVHEPRDSPSTPPSHNPAFKIDSNHSESDELDTSYTYAQYQRSGRITAPATSIPRFRKYTVEDFHFLAVLGKGSFGKVLLAELRNTEYYYAVKCLKKDVVLEDDDVECTLIERKVLALGTKHPYLCHLFCTFQTESHLFFVMEYLNGGDLMFHIQTSGRFPESRARFYAAEIISGLKFLHKKGIVYRDLKLDNVLLDFDGHVRIADFGMCKLQIYLDRTADSFCGTPDYMAPEIIKGQKYNQTVDWWSFGVLLYEMLIGQSPFSGCDEDELFWSICNETPWIPAYLSKEATNIVKALLEKDASIRLGSALSPLGDIADHRFFHTLNWQKLEHRELDPPFKPAVRHPLDTQYFDQTFTKERVRLTPIMKEILHSMDQEQFQGFSYTNPNATLT